METQGADAQKLCRDSNPSLGSAAVDPGAVRLQSFPGVPLCQFFTTQCSLLPIQNQMIKGSHDGMCFGMYG